jgi:hypothetical protein
MFQHRGVAIVVPRREFQTIIEENLGVTIYLNINYYFCGKKIYESV